MAKPEWGTKRTCPNCGERFYDLGKENPVVCINCAHEWVPEPILKAKQPIIVEEKPKDEEKPEDEVAVDDEDDLDIDEDDDLADVSLDDDDDEEVGAIVDTSLTDDEDN